MKNFLRTLIMSLLFIAIGVSLQAQDTERQSDNNRNKTLYVADSFLVANSYTYDFDVNWKGGSVIDCNVAGVTYEGGSETVSVTSLYKLHQSGAWLSAGDTAAVTAINTNASIQHLVNASDIRVRVFAGSASDTLLAQVQCLIKEVDLTDEQ
jgi:hypothetical protein